MRMLFIRDGFPIVSIYRIRIEITILIRICLKNRKWFTRYDILIKFEHNHNMTEEPVFFIYF